MPKKVRRRIFYCLILAFLVLGTGVVLYAKGWRLSLQPFGLAKIGGIYVRTAPADAAIALNGKAQQKSSGFFQQGALLNDLLPDTYDLAVSEAGFQTWSMSVAVQSSLVTSMQYIVLVPTGATAATTTAVQSMQLAGNILLLKTAMGMETLSGAPVPGDALLANSQDGTILLTSSSSSHSYLETDLSQATSTDLGRLGGQTFTAVPGDDTLFLAQSSTGLNLLRVPTGETLPLATTSVSAVAAASGRAVWTTYDAAAKTSLISYYDISAQSLSSDTDSLPGRVTRIFLRDPIDLFLLTSDGSLYSLSLGQSSRVRLDQDVRAVALSNDDNELAVLDAKGVQAFFLRGDQPNIQISLPDAAAAQSVAWYTDNEHLFVQYPDHVAFLDLADTALKNYVSAAASGETVYENANNTLYFLKDDVVYELAFPSY